MNISHQLTQITGRWLPPILLMFIIFIFSSMSSIPQVNDTYLDTVLKKLGHMLGYGLLMISWIRALNRNHPPNNYKVYIYSFILTFIYAISDEWHQSYVPFRHPSDIDITIDCFGAIIGGFLYFRYMNISKS
jgi:VanZ family protein